MEILLEIQDDLKYFQQLHQRVEVVEVVDVHQVLILYLNQDQVDQVEVVVEEHIQQVLVIVHQQVLLKEIQEELEHLM